MSLNLESKFLPLWHAVSLQGNSQKFPINFGPEVYPDHGGAGVDISVKDSDFECLQLKCSNNPILFRAEMCSLPLLPPNKVVSLKDPCLGKLLKKAKKQLEFCRSVQVVRSKMKSNQKLRKCILNAQQDASELQAVDKLNELTVPRSVIKLAKLFPKKFPIEKARWKYIGGSLALYSSANGALLLHPVGKNYSQLALTPLTVTTESFRACPEKQIVKSLKGGRIYQVTVNSSMGSCCVLQNKKYHFIKLNDVEDKSSWAIETYSTKERLSNVKISPYVPGEHVVATNSGSLYLKNANSKKTIWQLEEQLSHDPYIQDYFWTCDFGAQPRSILYSDRMNFGLLDLRSQNCKALSILSSPNPFLLDNEHFSVTKRFGNTHFQHLVATDVHLLICDERYPQQPVMSWSHMLESTPLYCDVQAYKNYPDYSESVVLLGSQESADIAAFHVNSTSSSIQPQSLSHPLHLSSPRDYVKTLKLLCHEVDDCLTQRLSLPLVGVCAVPPSDEAGGYTVLQMTSVGDVFYQKFLSSSATKEKTFRVGLGCALPPVNNVSSDMVPWIKEAIANFRKVKVKNKKKTKNFNINKKDLVNEVHSRKKLSSCLMCASTRCDTYDAPDHNDICSCCGLTVNYSKILLECERTSGLLCGPSKEKDEPNGCQLVDFCRTKDPLSKKLLAVWNDNETTVSTDDMDISQSLLKNVFPYQESLIPQASMNDDVKDIFAQRQQPTDVWMQDEDVIPPSQNLNPSAIYVGANRKTSTLKSSTSFGF